MSTLARLGWTALLVLIQPVKLLASIVSVALWVGYDVGCEFARDLRAIWTGA